MGTIACWEQGKGPWKGQRWTFLLQCSSSASQYAQSKKAIFTVWLQHHETKQTGVDLQLKNNKLLIDMNHGTFQI
jgi:hypothetical protein